MSDNVERTLYCGNLSERVTEDILYELFLQAGPLENVSMPKDKDGKPKRFAFITFKHAISVPYAFALMHGITLYGKPLKLDPRTGAETKHNPYLEKLMQYSRNSIVHQNIVSNRNYNANRRDSYEDNSRRYDSRRFESRPEPQRADHNQWNPYSPQLFNVGLPVAYPSHAQNQGRYPQNPMPQVGYPYGRNWPRNQR